MKSRTEARYSGYGYDHLVHIENACQQDMHCVVTTSANAEGVSADIPAGETRTVITRRGSPAREFSHALKCAPK